MIVKDGVDPWQLRVRLEVMAAVSTKYDSVSQRVLTVNWSVLWILHPHLCHIASKILGVSSSSSRSGLTSCRT